MIAVDGKHIYLTRGDTASIKIQARGYTFTESGANPDKAVFTLQAPDGSIVKQVAITPTDGAFEVPFLSLDTANCAPGDGYNWGVTYYMNPYYRTGETIPYNGNVVYTPEKTTLPFTIWTKAGG